MTAVAMSGTAAFVATAADDSDVVQVSLALGAVAIVYHLFVSWLAGPLRDGGPAEPLSRYAGIAVGLVAALVLGWPSGDWIPDNDPRVTHAFLHPASNLAVAWLWMLAGYAATVPLVLLGARVAARVREPRHPGGSQGEAAAVLDLLVIGVPLTVIEAVTGALPMPGDGGVPVITSSLLAAAWCGVCTFAGAILLARRPGASDRGERSS